jgi:hypothetical protein
MSYKLGYRLEINFCKTKDLFKKLFNRKGRKS